MCARESSSTWTPHSSNGAGSLVLPYLTAATDPSGAGGRVQLSLAGNLSPTPSVDTNRHIYPHCYGSDGGERTGKESTGDEMERPEQPCSLCNAV